MKIEEIDSSEYSKLFEKPYIPYNSVQFNVLNSHKVDELKFLLFHEGALKIGIIGGIMDKGFYSPFSAPFSGFTFQNQNVNTSSILEAVTLLDEYSATSDYRLIKLTLPPSVYNEHLISKMIFCLSRDHYSVIIDDNHHYYLKDFVHYENGTIRKGVRYNLKVAARNGLFFKKISNIEDKKTAYNVIKINKESKNRPLWMTFEQLLEMESLVEVDYYLVYHGDQAIASVVVYVYSPRIVQIIYWGDLPGFSCYYPMNFLAMNIFRVYMDGGFEIIDLGNSSENSEPNFGLSNFKERIGCTATTKFTFLKTF